MDESTRPEMGRNESELSYVTARETAEDERPAVPVVLEPIIQVEHSTSTTTNTVMGTTGTGAKPGTGTAPTTPIKSSLTTHISRTRSGSGTRFSPSSNPHAQSQTGTTGGSVARRGSLVEASAGLQKWWNSVRNPGVAEEHAVAEEEGNDAGLKREISRSREGITTTGPTATGTTAAGPSGNSTNAVFGERLEMSLIYAAVPISTARHEGSSAGSASGSGTGSGAGPSGHAPGAGAAAGTGVGSGTGESYVWGYVPVVVAKCGSHLKETATNVEGTFRVSGSAKRMKDLQAVFDSPPKYGKDLDWSQTQYTTHDVATILRRYLTQMPEPIIPHELYYDFRNVMADTSLTEDEQIAAYKDLILRMPKPNQYLLLYVLDMLSVFARRSDVNLMTAGNLATIFQPGIIAHPDHEMLPSEHAASQKVLEFLINKQDHFLIGMELEPVRSRSTGMSASPVSPVSSKQHPAYGAASLAPPMVAETSNTSSTRRRRGSSIHKQSLDRKAAASPALPAAPPRPPSPQRADSSIMPASDSDDEAPEGGWYVKTGDPTSLLRSRTAAANAAIAAKGTRRTSGGGVMTSLSNRRASKTGAAIGVSAEHASAAPQVTVVENPEIAAIPARGLFRRRTAPTRRNKEDEAELRKRAERAVRDLGKMSAEAP